VSLTELEQAEKLFYFPVSKKWTHKADICWLPFCSRFQFRELQMILLF